MALPTTDLELANLALSKIGHTTPILNLTTDQTPEAVAARQFLDLDRERALAAGGAIQGRRGWSFAYKRAVLVAAASQTHDGWDYFYTAPGDLVRGTGWLWVDVENPAPDELEPFDLLRNTAGTGHVIGCNLPVVGSPATEPILIYTFRATNVALYTPEFLEFFAQLLAFDLAMPVTKKTEVQAAAYSLIGPAFREALNAEERGRQARQAPDTPSKRARG